MRRLFSKQREAAKADQPAKKPKKEGLKRALELGAMALRETADERRYQLWRDMGALSARSKKAIRPMLRSMAALEQMGKPSSIAAARKLNGLLSTERGRSMAGSAAEAVAAEFPDSNLMLFVRCVALAKQGEVKAAGLLVQRALDRVQGERNGAQSDVVVQIARIWRVIDAIARDDMTWLSDEGSAEVLNRPSEPGPAPAEPGEDATGADRREDVATLALAEPLLQSRSQDRYLELCGKLFADSPSLQAKLDAVRAMMRQGLRPRPAYHDAFAQARASYEQLRPEVLARTAEVGSPQPAEPGPDRGVALVRLLKTALFVARKLRFADDQAAIETALLELAVKPGFESVLWTAVTALVESDPKRHLARTRELVAQAKEAPSNNREVEGFMSWALKAGEWDAAERLYTELPERLKRTEGLVPYVRLLASRGRFEEACQLMGAINAGLISNARRMSPINVWNNLRRQGEMAFCADTAELFLSVPQPSAPVGVLFVLARSVDHLRRYPIVVLMELKKAGWAVVPVVAGLLPEQKTGDPAIDQFVWCLDATGRLRKEAQASFPPLKDFVVDVAEGKLRWGGIELDHALWEEAAINRRRFSVDFTCPSLGEFLGRLVAWTRGNASVLQHAHAVMGQLGLPAAFMTLSQSRLPDVLSRFYCETFGDPEWLFCLHAANGYENYFGNFSSVVSTKAVLRNMTASPEMRSASFPHPDEFEAWYRSRAAAETTADVVEMTMRRKTSAARADEDSPRASAVETIRRWREEGGKVACAFGKLTCDLAAPRDGGPAHADMKDWLNHTIESVRGSRTLLLVKPHPHERRDEIGTFLTEEFVDLIDGELPPNVVVLGHDWFSTFEMKDLIDLGLIYNGTVSVELGVLGVPCVLCSDFAHVDYPIGHAAPRDRDHYRRLVRFEAEPTVVSDLRERSAAWIRYMRGDELTVPYRYHARPVTNKVVYPPWWFQEDVDLYNEHGDEHVLRLVAEVTDRARRAEAAASRRRAGGPVLAQGSQN